MTRQTFGAYLAAHAFKVLEGSRFTNQCDHQTTTGEGCISDVQSSARDNGDLLVGRQLRERASNLIRSREIGV